VIVSLEGERVELCDPLARDLRAGLAEAGFDVIGEDEICFDRAEIAAAVDVAAEAGATAIVYAVGTWLHPPAIVRTVESTRLPAVIVGNTLPASFGFTGASIVHGALDRLGLVHQVHLGGPADVGWHESVLPFLRASAVAGALREATYGLIGGQGPGQYVGSLDQLEVRETFGIELEPVEELAVVDRARGLAEIEVEHAVAQLDEHSGPITADPAALRRSIRLHLALRMEIAERAFDLVSIKCLGETINSYASFCVAASVQNDARRVVSCQGDIPTTIVMDVLRRLSGGAAFMADLITLDMNGRKARLGNCGAAPVSLAARPSAVHWLNQYDYMGAGGGATSSFALRSGEVTMAALSRTRDTYRLMIVRGRAAEVDRAEFAEIRERWPYAFLDLDGDLPRIVEELRSNHVAMAYGDHAAELAQLARLWGIEAALI